MKPFEVVCLTCLHESNQKQLPYNGLVNHNYVSKKTSVLIQYHCFTCETNFELEVNWFNPKSWPPKDKEDFKKKLGIKDIVIN